MGEDESISDSLLARLKVQAPGAWERVVQLYTPLLCYWARASGVQDDDEDDVVQDILLSVARSIERFDRGEGSGSFRGWMRVIARNRIADHFQTRRRVGIAAGSGGTASLAALDQIAGAAPGLEADELSCLYQQALRMIDREFEPRTMDVFRRLMVDDESPAEVARALGMSIGAVYQAKHRVLSRLRDELSEMIA